MCGYDPEPSSNRHTYMYTQTDCTCGIDSGMQVPWEAGLELSAWCGGVVLQGVGCSNNTCAHFSGAVELVIETKC